MKAVGIKVLKDNLSKYLDYVREGDVVFVTDHDEIIAEIHQASLQQPFLSSLESALLQESRQGLLIKAKRKQSNAIKAAKDSNKNAPVIAMDVLNSTREDRF